MLARVWHLASGINLSKNFSNTLNLSFKMFAVPWEHPLPKEVFGEPIAFDPSQRSLQEVKFMAMELGKGVFGTVRPVNIPSVQVNLVNILAYILSLSCNKVQLCKLPYGIIFISLYPHFISCDFNSFNHFKIGWHRLILDQVAFVVVSTVSVV